MQEKRAQLRLRSTRVGGFTIIELLIVMAIIIVLAGLIIGTSGYVQKKGARSRAEAEIAAFSAALESYKADNGVYPSDTATNGLDATNTNSTSYKAASLVLYKALSGDTNADRASETKGYFSFKPNQLGPPPPSAATVEYIRDPFGHPYGYSTSKNPTANASADTAAGYNPTFDLWSTAGTANPAEWIKNW